MARGKDDFADAYVDEKIGVSDYPLSASVACGKVRLALCSIGKTPVLTCLSCLVCLRNGRTLGHCLIWFDLIPTPKDSSWWCFVTHQCTKAAVHPVPNCVSILHPTFALQLAECRDVVEYYSKPSFYVRIDPLGSIIHYILTYGKSRKRSPSSHCLLSTCCLPHFLIAPTMSSTEPASASPMPSGVTDPNYKPLPGRLGNLTMLQVHALEKLKKEVKEEGKFVPERMDDATLLRSVCIRFEPGALGACKTQR